jgi:hypothetical protein
MAPNRSRSRRRRRGSSAGRESRVSNCSAGGPGCRAVPAAWTATSHAAIAQAVRKGGTFAAYTIPVRWRAIWSICGQPVGGVCRLLAINAAGFRIPGREGGILSVSQNECCSAKRDVRVFLPRRFDGAFERLQILEHTIVPRSLTISTKRISQAFFVIVVDFVFVVTGCQPVQPRQPKCLWF